MLFCSIIITNIESPSVIETLVLLKNKRFFISNFDSNSTHHSKFLAKKYITIISKEFVLI